MKLKLIDLFKRITWAKNGDLTDFSQTNYEAGWAHLGDDTPTVQDFNYVQQMNDKKDQWLFNQLKAVLEKANIEPTEENVNSLRDAILALSKGYSNPKSLTADTVNFIDEQGHTHEIAKATLQQQGIVQLTNDTGLESESLALTAKAGKKLAQQTAQLQLNVSQNYINNSKKSSAVNSNSADTVATSAAVKTAYDKAVEAKTTADGKVGLNGNESINGEKTFENRIVAKRNIRISDNPHYASYGDHLNIGANNGDCWFEYKSSNREIGTLRMHANGDFTYKRNKIYHEGAKPQFNTDIEDKPDTLAGYGIGNFKVEQGQGDANGYKTDGNYYLASGQNLPENGEWHIEVVSGGATDAVRQIARKANDNKIKTRFFNGSNWSEWKDAGGDGVPIGAVVSFPRAVTNPVGFLRADGSTFRQQTFPDLYRTLGDSNQLPDLTRSDVGMTAYFAVDNIPAGWIAFDEIATQVTEQRYPELYRHLVGKYGSIERVPKVADRFLRNAGNGLSVGQTQEDEFKRHVHKHIEINTASDPRFYNDKTFDYDSRDSTDRTSLDIGTALRDDNDDNWWITPNINSKFATGGAETRPKSLILKLCIKAINSFDDAVFWIKSHGEVTNAGALDAGRLAQGLQDKAERNHTHTVSQITDFNQSVREIVTQSIAQNLAETGWCKLPNGMILQWGLAVLNRGYGRTTDTYITFPIRFPSSCFNVVMSYGVMTDKRVTQDPVLASLDQTGVTVRQQSDRDIVIYWRAIGV
ncbi:pyocin knob domain-containing protein [Haemophilus influenzae]|uniref:pyocin knob domain-containing protein n=1 Tax=Haemophilus influenzae TaxID=727 RepID=UPI000DA2D4DC|nr:pyocin knob domain-containing protein [Haemophilus influenzae]MCK8804593.1 pyocin knob domain-containing protein [Haemophilus influenzae]MCK8896862.1 pyocin knob domain-containing protein [Haemophilus influenzae]MCK8971895.1 pyocin knob domain-containing protein [Haemophilus influenzae]MCK8985896.1 pyocin knob domain-containing protein [Haemophilus influenzae]MCK9074489.1 pyocin knob domain-containing protein [Haemophilus influenzae]